VGPGCQRLVLVLMLVVLALVLVLALALALVLVLVLMLRTKVCCWGRKRGVEAAKRFKCGGGRTQATTKVHGSSFITPLIHCVPTQ
jgi:hypothetical protein